MYPRYTGPIEILEVYVYYDVPRLYACQNTVGQIFIINWIDSSPINDAWHCIAISEKRFNLIRHGVIDLREAFLTPETNTVCHLISTPGGVEIIEKESFINPLVIPEEHLPADGFKISSDDIDFYREPLKPLGYNDATTLARHIGRNAVLISFKSRDKVRLDSSAGFVGRSLFGFQELVDACGQAKSGLFSTRGAIPIDIKKQNELVVSGLFEGSFGVKLVATTPPNIFGDNLLNDALETVNDLIRAGDSEEAIKALFSSLKSRVALRYKEFLESLVHNNTDCRQQWSSPDGRHEGDFALDVRTAEAALRVVNRMEVIETNVLSVAGTLIGGNIRSYTFEFEDFSNNRYAGRADALSSDVDVDVIALRRNYLATIQETVKFRPATGAETKSYELLNLQDI